MNLQNVKAIIAAYKKEFNRISKEEIYKWQAVKCFQDNWDIEASNFPSMLDKSISKTKNLLASGKYYPRGMLLKIALSQPNVVKELFRHLYNEEMDIFERISTFMDEMNRISNKLYPGDLSYQDPRAVMVYLSLKFPDRYFLYKFEMFREFAPLVGYPYQPKSGALQNISEFQTLCTIVKAEIIKDNDLIALHKTRISATEYNDNSLNILTQDVIYAASEHLKIVGLEKEVPTPANRLTPVSLRLSPSEADQNFKGVLINYLEIAKENKRIGDLGELLVLEYEQCKLQSLGIKKIVEHKSASEGDGLGYDILSYDEKSKPIFIEVKTTTGNEHTPFFVTGNELARSIQDSKNYFLYRLFNFDDLKMSAKYFTVNGDLSALCTNPTGYKVVPGKDSYPISNLKGEA